MQQSKHTGHLHHLSYLGFIIQSAAEEKIPPLEIGGAVRKDRIYAPLVILIHFFGPS